MRCTRWQGLPFSSKPKVKKGLWSPEEDEKLINYMMKNGLLGCSWSYLAKQIGLQRCGKSCRLRWTNYLRPGLKRGAISPEEEQLIIHLQSIFGNRWSQIVAYLPGRTDNDIKNYWNSCIRKKLNLKQWLPCSSTTEPNGNNNIKPNIQNVMGTAENEYSCVQEVLDLKYEQLNMPNNVLPVDQNSFITAPATTAWNSTHSYSNEAEFTDVYPGAYTTHNVEHYLSLQENTTNKSCPSQFSTPGITWPNVDQSSNFQAQGQYEWQDPVNSSYHGEAYLGEPVYNINVHTQNSYQLPEIGGEQDVDQGDWSTIPINEKAEATSIPRLSMLGFQCESESDQVTVWAQDDHFYSRVPFL